MGDNHVCSFCSEEQQGKQHIKIVFENWPIEETVIYRRKGKERTANRKLTKEVITVIGMECISNPEKWGEFDIGPGKVKEFFEDLRFVGKNPQFRAIVERGIDRCLALNCFHKSLIDETCRHLSRLALPYTGLDQLSCVVGHPGVELVRHRQGEFLPGSWKSFKQWWKVTPHRGYYIALSAPYLFAWFILYPIWWLKIGLKRIPLRALLLSRL